MKLNQTELLPIWNVAEAYLKNFASDADFVTKMQLAFGDSYDLDSATNFARDWIVGDFSGFPVIKVRPAAEINGANGAFASATNTIYLSQEFISQNDESLIATVLLEEYGHYLDSQINVLDATGDEGQIFAALVQGENLSQATLSGLLAEDDTANIILDGEAIEIEQQDEAEIDFSVNEDAGSISFPLFATAQEDNTGPTDPAQYTLSLDEGSSTATPGEDFENLFPIDILFPGGVLPGETIETTTRIIIPIVNDDSSENDETIVLTPGNFSSNFNPFSDPVIVAIVDDDGIDLDPLRVGGNFEEISDNRFEASGTIRIGRSDGLFPLLTLEGEANYDENIFSASGTFLSSIGSIQEPLFEGSIEIPIGTATATSFQDNGNSPEQFGLAGLDIDFSSLALTQNGMRLESQFSLPDEITGRFINISLSQPDALFISQNGPRIGVSGSIDFPEQQFSLFDLLNVNASDLAISYDAPQDAIKIQGKITVDSFTKSSDTEVVADLSGSNFIQVRDEDGDGDAEADIVGSLSVKNLDLPGGWGLSEAAVTLDTINDSIGGDVKVTFPFASREIGVGLGLEFMPINPLELNRISAEVDGLQLAIGNTGAFLQSLSGGVNNLAPSNTDPIEFTGGVGITAGPEVFGNALANLDLSATISSERVTGMGQLTIIDSRIVNASGSATLDWNQKFLSTNSNFSILSGLIQTENSFRTDPRFNINMAGSASVSIPNFEFLPFGGTRLGSGNFLLDFSNDGNFSNDFAQGWQTIQKTFLGFDVELVAGFRGFFDGRFEPFGADEILPTNSFDVEADTEFILLNVNWDNSTSENVPVQVIDNNGNLIQEADFAANNIAIVEELTNETNKTVIIVNPAAGVWDIEVVDDTGLGEVRVFATRDSEAPTIEVTAPAVDVTGPEVTIEWDAFDANSDAEIKLFYDTDNEGFDGVLITDGLTEMDGAGDFIWNTEGVPTGDYFIYAMVMDENNPPAFSYSTGTVQITEEADISVTKTASADTVSVGEELIYTVTVTNNGTIDSTGITLTDTLPDEVEFVSSSIAPSTQSNNTLTFEIDDLSSGESTTFEMAVTPTTTGTIANSASVMSNTFDPDATNDAIVLATTVTEPAPDLAVTVEDPGFVVTGNNFTYSITVTNNGPAQATGVTLTNNLPGAVNFVSATSSQGDISDSGRIVTANLGDLDSGETATVDILVTPIAADLLTNIVSVTSNEPDPDLTNNSIIQTTQVNAELLEEADLELTKTVNNLTPNVGELVTFTLTLANNGPGLASRIEVTDLLPPSLSFVSAEPDRGSYDEVTGIWSVADVQDGLSTSLAIAATVETIGTLINTAEISAVDQDDPDSTPNNNNPDEDDQASITLNSSSNLMVIEGTPGNDTLVGTEGEDSIAGLSGSDRLFGLSSNDILNGGPDNDILDGSPGNDTVIGGAGRDILIGGPNSDIFVLPTDTAAPDESQADVILAFQLNFLDPTTPTDLIGLTGGLTEADLNLEPSNVFRQGTIILDADTDRVLGVVANIPPDRLSGLFVSIDSGLF